MHNIEQFVDNLTNTQGWSGAFDVTTGGETHTIISTHLPMTGPDWTVVADTPRMVRHTSHHPSLAEAVTATEPILDALFAAKAAQYGEPATYPGLAKVAA